MVHVGEGVGAVTVATQAEAVQARTADHGPGISLQNLPNATLRKGFTTVVVEQDRVPPLPVWWKA